MTDRDALSAPEAGATEATEVTELAPAIDSRFLFVDVAARRAIQLKRGARIRLDAEDGRHLPHKLERAAMEEVRRQLIHYTVPDPPATRLER